MANRGSYRIEPSINPFVRIGGSNVTGAAAERRESTNAAMRRAASGLVSSIARLEAIEGSASQPWLFTDNTDGVVNRWTREPFPHIAAACKASLNPSTASAVTMSAGTPTTVVTTDTAEAAKGELVAIEAAADFTASALLRIRSRL